MQEAAPQIQPIDIEVEDGLSLHEFDPHDTDATEFGIWNGEAIVGSIALVHRGRDAASISYVLDVEYQNQGVLTKSLSKMPEVLESLGLKSVVAELDAGFDPDGRNFGATDLPYRNALETAGFRVAAYSHQRQKILYELIDNPPHYNPVRVNVD
jgi:hypothetical protein